MNIECVYLIKCIEEESVKRVQEIPLCPKENKMGGRY